VKANQSPQVANPDAPTAALLTKGQLAEFLKLTPRSIENLHRRGLPFYRIGCRRNRYDLNAVRAWLDRTFRVTRAN
jgi:phage terminase Nu1 subunit (DNA packaging protein)